MDSSTPFIQQISRHLVSLFIVIVLTIACAVFLFDQQIKQTGNLKNQQLPAIEHTLRLQKNLVTTNVILANIATSNDSKSLFEFHLQYLANLVDLHEISTKNKQQYAHLIKLEDKHHILLKRLANNNDRNIQLQQSSLIQLQLISDELKQVIEDKKTKQNQLYQQINNDDVKDQVTSVRAKAYVELTKSLTNTQQTETKLTDFFVMLKQLDLQFSLAEFNYLSSQLEQNLALWQLTSINIEQENEAEKLLLNLLLQLNNLLFIEQNTIAKWRGTLRISQDYIAYIGEQQQIFNQQLSQLTLPQLQVFSIVPDILLQPINSKLTLTPINNRLIVFALFSLLSLLILILILRLRKKLVGNYKHTYAVIEQALMGNTANDKQLYSAENQRLLDLIAKTHLPKHNEIDYQNINDQLSFFQQFIFQHVESTAWQINRSKIPSDERLSSTQLLSNNSAIELLFTKQSINSTTLEEINWRSAFSKTEIKSLIKCAKKSRTSNQVESVIVTSQNGQTFTVTITRKEQAWCGTITRNETYQNMTIRINQLEQQLIELEKNSQMNLVENSQQLSHMLVRTMLKSQSVSIDSDVTSLQVYRQLARIFDWCRQLEINNTIAMQINSTSLDDVNVRDELCALIHNIMVEAHPQRNQVYLHVDEQVLAEGKLNVRLFHRTLTSIARILLLEELKANLYLKVTAVENNAGQQVLRFSFYLICGENNFRKGGDKFPEVIGTLLTQNTDELENAPQIIRYLYNLFAVIHVDNLQGSMLENGLRLSLDLPIAYSENETKSGPLVEDVIDLKNTLSLLICNEPLLIDIIDEHVRHINGQLEHLANADNFIKQVSSKQLTQQPLAVVIISADILKNDYQQIKQHIQTLPLKLQPKLMVLQTMLSHSLHQTGLFNQSCSPLIASEFQLTLSDLISSDSSENILLPAKAFDRYRFSQTQVEVLVAIAEPNKHRALLSLLHWMGLQVQLVCQPQAMLKHWQSGRYLLLITEFKHSPLIDIDVGKNVQRGIFTINQQHFNLSDTEIINSVKNWHQLSLPDIFDIDSMVTSFSPWLKVQQFSLTESTKQTSNKVTMQSADVEMENQGTETDLDKDQTAQFTIADIDLTPAVSDIETEAAFDLLAYANNQGSPELAVIMLDDYLEELDQAMKALAKAITEQELSQAIEKNSQIEKICRIMQATNLLLLSTDISLLLKAKQFEQAQAKLEEMVEQQGLIELFAQAI